MSRNDAVMVTVRDAIHTGIVLGLGPTRTLEIWRAMGGIIRTDSFHQAWEKEVNAFLRWRRGEIQSSSDTTSG